MTHPASELVAFESRGALPSAPVLALCWPSPCALIPDFPFPPQSFGRPFLHPSYEWTVSQLPVSGVTRTGIPSYPLLSPCLFSFFSVSPSPIRFTSFANLLYGLSRFPLHLFHPHRRRRQLAKGRALFSSPSSRRSSDPSPGREYLSPVAIHSCSGILKGWLSPLDFRRLRWGPFSVAKRFPFLRVFFLLAVIIALRSFVPPAVSRLSSAS